jgi:hypothetical protein
MDGSYICGPGFRDRVLDHQPQQLRHWPAIRARQSLDAVP